MPSSRQRHPTAVYSLMNNLGRLRLAIHSSTRLNTQQKTFLYRKTVEMDLKRTEIYWTRMAFNGSILKYRHALATMHRHRYYPYKLTEAVLKIGMNVETIYYLARVAFDLSTYIPISVYPTENLPQSFTDQMARFANNQRIDPQYSRFLANMSDDYSTFKVRRDDMTHYISAMVRNLQQNYPSGTFSIHPTTALNVNDVLRDAVILLDNFLRFFDGHFSALV